MGRELRNHPGSSTEAEAASSLAVLLHQHRLQVVSHSRLLVSVQVVGLATYRPNVLPGEVAGSTVLVGRVFIFLYIKHIEDCFFWFTEVFWGGQNLF